MGFDTSFERSHAPNTKPQATTEETLEPCPFCGSKPETGITGAPECDNWRYVKCSNNYCSIRYSLFTVKSWNTRHSPASVAPVVDEPQKMFPPPAEDKLHIAICNAVQSNQFTASDILRQALLDYQPTQLTRSELIRVQQRSGSDEVSAIMVSPAAATAAYQVEPVSRDLLSAFKELIKWHHMTAKHGGSADECEWAVCVGYKQIAEDCDAAPVEQSEIDQIRARAYNSIQFSADVYMHDVRRLLRMFTSDANEEAR